MNSNCVPLARARAFSISISLSLATFATVAPAWADDEASPPQTVVVTASPITDQDKLATLVDSVSRDEILEAGGANLSDALAYTPGVSGTSFAAGASRPVIRGFDANRVRVLESGIGSFDVSDLGPDHGIPIDPLATQRIEVVRGAATLRYGSQAIGGVVNAINNRVPTQLPEESLSGEVSGLYGTNADTRQGSALLDARLGSSFALHADGYKRKADDYDTPRGILGNSFFDGDGYSLGGSYFFGDNRIGAAVVQYDAVYGIPGEDAYIDMKQTKELMRSSFAIGAGPLQTITVEGGYADYEHSEREEDGVAAATFKNREWEGRAEALFGAAGPFSASALGVQLHRKDFSALGEAEDYLLPATTKSAAAFFFGDAPIGDRIHLHTGARVEDADIEGTPLSGPTSRSFTPISASVGLLYDASRALRFGVTLSSAARAPAQTELYARGPHEATATYETGDPSLDVERANSLEFTLRSQLSRARFEGAVWGARFSDYIFGSLTGRTCDEEGNCVPGDGEESKELVYLQDDARFWGAEAKGVFDLLNAGRGSIQATALADYVRARLDDGTNVPRITPWHVGAGLNWDGGNVDAGLMLKYSGRQNKVGVAETPTAGFLTMDAQAAWRPFSANPGVEVALIGKNLTDSVQRNALALNKDEVILPGREVRLMVRAAF